MKRFLVLLLALICVGTLIYGSLHWKEKTSVSAEKADTQEQTKEEPEQQETPAKVDTEKLLKLTENWPKAAREHYKMALEEGRPFTILLAGSNALGTDDEGWSIQLKHSLEEAYGDTIEVEVKSYELTSSEFMSEEKLDELVSLQPDLTLLEPFTLMDNGLVMISNSHQNIEAIRSGLSEANPEHVMLLQPPNPLYNANYYPVQVDALKQFAEEEEIPYLNHWTAWPDPESKEIEDYLVEQDGTTLPNEKGHQVWYEYLLDYFIAD
ncbi:SGNH/GDSL hydrolase family protein [Mesobacillus maritimus]|uniref:SGNH/GDSL hydrolase family protein n=1 Tax=Mesobacillus maritimus TaxID=1643336 RepID=UPI002041738D|nr:SGNH/GDSL hydrolase family protein [Mesobacillus maritimus]MCM3586965.1 SGNH/GDSL hydrolase family protein [Mesobacillus maritimus]